jgi:hypothetical protein
MAEKSGGFSSFLGGAIGAICGLALLGAFVEKKEKEKAKTCSCDGGKRNAATSPQEGEQP